LRNKQSTHKGFPMIPQAPTICPSKNYLPPITNLSAKIIIEGVAKLIKAPLSRRWSCRSVFRRTNRHPTIDSAENVVAEPSAHRVASDINSATPSVDDRLSALFFQKLHLLIAHANASRSQFSEEPNEHEDFPVGQFIRFLKHIKLKNILSKITDKRNPNKVIYTNDVILQWALSVFFFRRGSKNSFQTALECIKPYQRKAILKYLGLNEDDSLPHRTTVDDFLSKVDAEEINNILLTLFNWAKKNKIFYNHAGVLLPNNQFHLCCDGLSLHKYNSPHAVDENGENCCPYCLPRTHNKGKPEEKTYWLHNCVNVALIFPGGLQLPIYVYPLKSEQIHLEPTASEEKLKQECELQAAYAIFPELKQKLGKLAITVLTDSLYANEPVIQLCEKLGWEYLIVRQVGSLKAVGNKCDELEKLELYQKSFQAKQIIKIKDGSAIEQTIKWFNRVAVGKEAYTNVLRFEEVVKDSNGNVIKKRYFKTEWLTSTTVTRNNCFALAKRGRMRADHEDIHNTLKNRGFEAKHDYARANPHTWLIWKLLMFVAFIIFELFGFTSLARTTKGSRSWMDFAKDIFSDIMKVPWEKIALSPTLRKERIQFRFVFNL
jgi:hypothetical protein